MTQENGDENDQIAEPPKASQVGISNPPLVATKVTVMSRLATSEHLMRNSLLAAILALWTGLAASAQTVPPQDGTQAAKFVSGPPPIVVSPAAVDFGFIPPGSKRVATVSLQNTSTQPITLIAVQPTCACTTTTN